MDYFNQTRIELIDYVEQGASLYIQLNVADGKMQKTITGEVRFLEDLLYGELIHERKSPLSEQARIETITYLKNHFGR